MKSSTKLLFGCVIFISFLLRIFQISEIPPGLNRDEAAIGYTAYSLLKTGTEEYGKFLPVSLKSFGDWKLPFYAYITVPFVVVLGLTEFTVRLPSMLAGIGTIFLTFFIALRLFKSQKIAFIATILIAISPWHIFFSRVTSEANIAVFLSSCAVLFFTYAHEKKWLLILGSILLSLTLFTYHGNHIFTPLFFVLNIIFFRKVFFKPVGYLSIALFLITSGIIFSHTLLSADKTKISGLLSINDASLVHEHIVLNRIIYKNELLAKLFNNKVVFFVEDTARNYIRSFSPEYLVISGGTNQQHNIPDFGNLYLIELPFFMLGLYFLFAKKEKAAFYLLAWILISPLGASLTKDAPHSARQFAIFPGLILISAYGVANYIDIFKLKKNRLIASVIIVILFSINISIFLNRYFILFPYKSYDAWGGPYKELVHKLEIYKNKYSKVTVSRPEYSPYIYYLFYQKSDPYIYQNTVERYEETQEGFHHVKAFDGIHYEKIGWGDELLLPNRLYIDWVEAIPSGATNSATQITSYQLMQLLKKNISHSDIKLGVTVTSRIIDRINLPNGSPLLYFIETGLSTPAGLLQ